MATRKRKQKKNSKKYCELEKLAYKMGLIDRGIKNPNSRVYESYNAALSSKQRTKKSVL